MKLKYYLRGLGIGIVVTAVILSISLHGKTSPMTDDEVKARAKELGMEEKYETGVLAEADAVSQNTVAETQKSENDATNIEEIAKADTEVVAEETKTTEPEEIKTDEDKPDNASDVETKTENPIAEKALEEAEEILTDADKEIADTFTKAEEDVEAVKEKSDALEDKKSELEQKAEELEEIKTDDDAGKTFTITVNSGDGSLTVAKKLKAAGVIEDAAAYDAFLCKNGYDKKICVGTHSFTGADDETQIAKKLTSRAK